MGLKLFRFLFRNAGSLRIFMGPVLLVIVMAAVSGVSTVAIINLINRALNNRLAVSGRLFWMFVGVCVFSAVTRLVSEVLLIRLAQHTSMELRMHLCRRILSAPLRELEKRGAHGLSVMLTSDIIVITNALSFLPAQCANIVIVVGGMIYLGAVSRIGLLIVVGFFALGAIIYQTISTAALSRLKLARQDEEVLFGHFRSLILGIKELKLYGARRQNFFSAVLKNTAESFNDHNIDGLTGYRAANTWGQNLLFFLIGMLLFVAPVWKVIGPANLVPFVLIVMYIMGPFSNILTIIPTFGRADIAVQKIEEIESSLAEKNGESRLQTPSDLPQSIESVELREIEHSYRREMEDGNFTLGPISLKFVPGQVVFLTGGNGSGKTTLAKLLVGLYVPESGSIFLSGRKIGLEDLDYYREHFSVVFADFHLFDRLLGSEDARSDSRAAGYLEMLHLEHKVRIKNGVFSTTDLSQGQRKRLALLTAYMEDKPFYVFDEWAADQDPYFKEIFYLQLLPELKTRGKTILVISHDDKYYSCADKVIKLENGQIATEQFAASHSL